MTPQTTTTRNIPSHNASSSSCSAATARLVSSSETSLEECGARLRNGHLVAFPTETVYGLGCHALDPDAVRQVFEAKERPLTDPLIVHVVDPNDAHALWEATSASTANENDATVTSTEQRALQVLADTFWPGPLTLVAKAAPHIPPILMANTGYVACRCPSHALARKLLMHAKVPIAAPSANKFGHVSPTSAQHVWDDLKYENVWILASDNANETTETNGNDSNTTASPLSVECNVGVESTVAKLECSQESSCKRGSITILRQGAVSAADLQECLRNHGLDDLFTVTCATQAQNKVQVAAVSPGQCYRHYSPDIPSFILSSQSNDEEASTTATARTIDELHVVSTTVVIDFHQRLASLKRHALAYRELSSVGDSSEAAQAVFETLRWAERVQGATRIVFPEIQTTSNHEHKSTDDDALTLALKDRLTRAASGVVIDSLAEQNQSDNDSIVR